MKYSVEENVYTENDGDQSDEEKTSFTENVVKITQKGYQESDYYEMYL